MRGPLKRQLRRYAIATVIAAAPLAILCAYVSNLLVPTEPLPKPKTYSASALNIVNTAVINEASSTVGIADSDMYDPNLTDADVIARFDDLEALGVDTLRVLVPWGAIQQVPPGSPLEQFFPQDWERIDLILSQAEERGMSVLGVLNATPYWGGADGQGCLGCPSVPPDPELFATFAAEAAERFQDMFPGVVSAYEVWNEPNSFRSWSPAVDPVAYTEVLKAAYTAIKGVDPDATVVAGVLGAVVTAGGFTMDPVTFIETMYANGAEGFFDALSYHPYNYDRTFAEQNPNFISPLRMLLEMRQVMIENGDEELRIWATEYGLPTYLDPDEEIAYAEQERFIRDFLNTWANGLTDAQLAQLPAEFQALADSWEEWIGPAYIYSLRDRLGLEATEQGSFGLFYFDEASGEWKMKPAGEFIRDLLEEPEEPGGGGLAEALAASLQKLVQQLADSISSVVQLQVVPQVTQSLQQLGAQVGNALANALAAWVGSIRLPTAQTTLADVEAVDSAALARTAVTETFEAAAAEAPASVDEVPAPVEEAPAPAEEAPALAEEAPALAEEAPALEETPVVVDPEVSEPEVIEPEVTDPEVTEPEDPATSDELPSDTGDQDTPEDESTTDPEDESTTDPDEESTADPDEESTTDPDEESDETEADANNDADADETDSESATADTDTDSESASGATGADGATGSAGADGTKGGAGAGGGGSDSGGGDGSGGSAGSGGSSDVSFGSAAGAELLVVA